MDEDLELALRLQEEEFANEEVSNFLPEQFRTPKKRSNAPKASIIAPELEEIDPTPDLQALFLQFNKQFFWGKLSMCEVKWSPRMTLCAGVCSYQRRAGFCSIRLSVPLLKLRPRKDFVETLLHEMIHALLFVTDNNDDHDGHGPKFHEHMYRINREAGTNISVYHSFHDEVDALRQHWWRCNGPCQNRPPYYGYVKRSMNRPPQPHDRWWPDHQASCGGTYTKVKEPEDYGKKKKRKPEVASGSKDIRKFMNGGDATAPKRTNGASSSGSSSTAPKGSTKSGQGGGGARGNIFGFGGPSFSSPGGGGGLMTKGKTGTHVVKPGWKATDNSSGGHVIGGVPSSSTGSASMPPTSASSSTSLSSASVRQAVRDSWLKKFEEPKTAKSSIVPTSPKRSESSSASSKVVACPCCTKSVPEESINRHLDECLNQSVIQSEFSEGGFKETDSTKRCPVCKKEVYQEEMAYHMEVCKSAR